METNTDGREHRAPGCILNGSVCRRSGRLQARSRHEQGQALVEFAFTLPLLLLIMFGIIAFGVTLNNYIVLENAVNASAQYLSTLRSATTDPCVATAAVFYSVAPSLTPSQTTWTIKLSQSSTGTPATYTYTTVASNVTGGAGSPSCPGGQSHMTLPGYPAQVAVTYPCTLASFAFNFSCNISATATYDIQ